MTIYTIESLFANRLHFFLLRRASTNWHRPERSNAPRFQQFPPWGLSLEKSLVFVFHVVNPFEHNARLNFLSYRLGQWSGLQWLLLSVKHGRTTLPMPSSDLSAPIWALSPDPRSGEVEIPLDDALMSALEAIRETLVYRTESVDCKGVVSAKHANDTWAS